MKRNCLKQKRWFITGVSSGLGRSLAEQALARGHFVAGTVRDDESARRFEATAPGRSLAYWACRDTGGCVNRSLNCSFKALGGLDVLVNNAGFGLSGQLEEVPEEQLRELFEVSFFAAVRTIQKVLPCFKQQKRGHIINVTCAYPGGANWSGFAAAAGALAALSDSLAVELAPHNIGVTRVELGPLDTDWHEKVRCFGQALPPARGGLSVDEAARRILEAAETCQLPHLLNLSGQLTG